ncbi:MAG: RNA 2',3'-cyclic phosphodiesterase [Pirellulales bacterium]
MIRTFVAIELEAAVQARAMQLIERLRVSEVHVNWVQRKNLHLTLKFLGDVPTLEMPAVCQTVLDVAATSAPLQIELVGAGAFPQLRRPRVVWLGVRSGSEQLVQLHRAIDEALRPLGHRGDSRPFKPHLTLGYVREGTSASGDLVRSIERSQDYAAGTSAVGDVLVMASHPGGAGPTYEVLARCPLAG